MRITLSDHYASGRKIGFWRTRRRLQRFGDFLAFAFQQEGFIRFVEDVALQAESRSGNVVHLDISIKIGIQAPDLTIHRDVHVRVQLNVEFDEDVAPTRQCVEAVRQDLAVVRNSIHFLSEFIPHRDSVLRVA